MKAWEVLKAIDEGKEVELSFKGGLYFPISKGWVYASFVSTLLDDRYSWRIKPEPRKVWIVESKYGLMSTHQDISYIDHNSYYIKTIHGPFELKD